MNSLPDLDLPCNELLPVAVVLPKHQATVITLCASIHARVSPPTNADELALVIHDDRLCRAMRHLRDALAEMSEPRPSRPCDGPDPY